MDNPLPPHLHQFAHPVAEAAWAAIATLDVGAQQELLERLELQLSDALVNPDKPGRRQRAIRALRRAKRLLGHSPSINEYRRLRDETHDPDLIPDSSIRSTFAVGGWNEALTLAGLVGVEEQVRLPVIVSRSPLRYTKVECLAALRDCAADIGSVPSMTMYCTWVQRPDVLLRPGRRPLTATPFCRLFGSFLLALAAAEVTSAEVQAFMQTDMRVRPAAYAYTDEEFFAALREVRDRLGRVPRSNRYMRVREEIVADSFAAGSPRTIPSYGAFLKRFGGWNDALAKAGMQPFEGRWTVGDFEPPTGLWTWTEEELLAFIYEACSACRGAETTLEEYIVWRQTEMKRTKYLGAPRRIAAKSTIAAHFGGWTRAMRRAFPKD